MIVNRFSLSIQWEAKISLIREVFAFVLLTSFFSSCAHFRPPIPIKEARAVWLTRFEYCQYTTTHDQDSIKSYISDVINNAASSNFNIIFFQVRGNGDAYYTPGLEPWGNLLTGNLGEDPGWDPLQFAIDLAHQRGLELHAWINTFPVWRGKEPPQETTPRSPFLEHPEWIVCDSSGTPMPLSDHYVSFSPGIPQVHDYIISVATDIVFRYDVDGIHFDYIRYPEKAQDVGYSHDSISVALFNSPEGNPYKLDWEDWQREQLNQFVAKMYNAITEIKPWVKISTAVIGSYIENNWNAYHSVYQDPRRWTELGKVDFITPMIYSPRRHPTNPFMIRSQEWKELFTLDRYVFVGIGSYRFNSREKNYRWKEAEGQIDDLRASQFPGMVFFASRSLQNHWEDLATTRFRTPANIPAMVWKDSIPPPPPQNLTAQIEGDIIKLSWSKSSSEDDVRHYNIYFSRKLPIDTSNSKNLRAVINGPVTEWTIINKRKVKGFYVAISALDAAWNESALSEPIRLVSTD